MTVVPRKSVKAKVAPGHLAERDWQKVIVNGMEERGWIVNHVGKARTAKGDWVTPTTSSGYPDLVAVRGPRLLAVEVKDRRKPVDPRQVAWLLLFATIPTANAWVLRPTMDWHNLAAWLTNPETAPVTYGFDPTLIGHADPALYLAQRRPVSRSAPGSPGATLSQPPGPVQATIL